MEKLHFHTSEHRLYGLSEINSVYYVGDSDFTHK